LPGNVACYSAPKLGLPLQPGAPLRIGLLSGVVCALLSFVLIPGFAGHSERYPPPVGQVWSKPLTARAAGVQHAPIPPDGGGMSKWASTIDLHVPAK
jgi:hypothetical protein